MHQGTVETLLSIGKSSAPAIGAPGKVSLSYDLLRIQIEEVRNVLASVGVSRGERVAVLLPNGPEMAIVFLAVSSFAVAAPLNPGYNIGEIEFYISDLRAKVIILKKGESEGARMLARKLGVAVLSIESNDANTISFSISIDKSTATSSLRSADISFARPEDIALVLHTSGTTARPKIVPLSNANLVASANNIQKSLELESRDVCLNIMPLFHIHGLIAAVLSSISAGALVICCPGLQGFRFFEWLKDAQATWFTGVPTMLQTILELAPRFAAILEGNRLRFIRSSSASLPASIMHRLEEAFKVPVIEAYGMTEASHQMASNPLPPAARYPGSVGLAAGPQIAIMNDEGALLAAEESGEVVIRGSNVMSGYENNLDANEKAFTNGWFRTGDQGLLDSNGYLRLTGRLKEIINRAGEKVSPLEVEEVLLRHPDVVQAASFAIPSQLFGEDVAAAVVLRDGANIVAEGLRTFVAGQLAAFKVPRRIVILDEIPKGPTGKIQRKNLATQLAVAE